MFAVDTPRHDTEHAGARIDGDHRVEEGEGMKPNVVKDRRRGLRVEARLQIELRLESGAASESSSTLNISSNGVYFTSRRFVAPLTKLGLRLLLPGETPGAPEQAVDCQGVVVRCVPEEPQETVNRYEVACYFTDTSEEFKDRISAYVQKHL